MALIPPSVPSGYHADMIDGGQPCSFNNNTGGLLVDPIPPGGMQILGGTVATCNNAGNTAAGTVISLGNIGKQVLLCGNAAWQFGNNNTSPYLQVPANVIVTIPGCNNYTIWGTSGLANVSALVLG